VVCSATHQLQWSKITNCRQDRCSKCQIHIQVAGWGGSRTRFRLDLETTWFLNRSDNFDQIVFIFFLWKS
jgi:hypothetical protein